MVAARIPFIAGNWKMNLDHLQAIAFVQKLAWTLKDAGHKFDEVEVAVFPPFTDIRSVQNLVEADKLELAYGAQDISAHDSGAYTGEISGAFLKALGASYAIIGHSERRQYHGENDEIVREKSLAAFKHGVVPVICVGETEAELDEFGPSAVPVRQLKATVAGFDKDADFVVAYEPVWAIGTGKVATEDQAEVVCAALRVALREELGDEAADRTRILYGGSVKAANIAGFMRQANIDGALVGGASLDVTEFSTIARFKQHAI
jgi:triosephosphate isomerase